VVEISSGRPYVDKGDFRSFSSEVTSKDLVWHQDRQDRKVTVVEGEGWQFQFNGSLPIELRENRTIMIPKEMYHRLIKGKTDLVLRIEKI